MTAETIAANLDLAHPPEQEQPMTAETIAANLDQVITVVGMALNAHAGAVVLLEDQTPVYMDGMCEWPEERYGQPVQMSGTLRRKGQAPEPAVGELVTQGIVGLCWVLESPSPNEG